MDEFLEFIISKDPEGQTLTGEKNYIFHLIPDLPSNDYWSFLVYDNETQLIIKTDQSWPSVFSTRNGLMVNQDGSVDVWFGPKAKSENKTNWIQTIPEKGWNLKLRLYGTSESGLDQKSCPGEIEKIS